MYINLKAAPWWTWPTHTHIHDHFYLNSWWFMLFSAYSQLSLVEAFNFAFVTILTVTLLQGGAYCSYEACRVKRAAQSEPSCKL